MFKRVLLCYDGSQAGRRALRRGAELAVLLGAQVHVLSIIPSGIADAAVIAGAAGHACVVEETGGYRKLLDESLEWLKARGVAAQGYLATGDTALPPLRLAEALPDPALLDHARTAWREAMQT